MDNKNEVLIYEDKDGKTCVDVKFIDEDVWVTKYQLADIYKTTRQNIEQHINNIYNDNELPKSTCKKFLQVQKEGTRNVKRNVEFYNLDAIISVGYRVNSIRATQFRRWVTNILKTFTIQGYVLDKERMKNGSFIDKDYFEKLLEEIREIRLSERRFYQKVTDIYATSIDYDPKSPISINFFKKVQNKIHYAVSKQTAAEIIYD